MDGRAVRGGRRAAALREPGALKIVLRLFQGSHRLSRRFRFYEKKRGHRRTVPQQFGSVGEALFFGFFLLVGGAGAVGHAGPADRARVAG